MGRTIRALCWGLPEDVAALSLTSGLVVERGSGGGVLLGATTCGACYEEACSHVRLNVCAQDMIVGALRS